MANTNQPYMSPASPAIFGSRPEATSIPDPWKALLGVAPQFGNITDLLSANILGGLRGELPYENAIRYGSNAAAVGAGVGGSPFARNVADLSVGRERALRQDLALQQALAAGSTLSNIGTIRPETTAAVQQANALYASAPDPVARGREEQRLFNEAQQQAINAQRRSEAFARMSNNIDGPIPSGGGGTQPIGYTAINTKPRGIDMSASLKQPSMQSGLGYGEWLTALPQSIPAPTPASPQPAYGLSPAASPYQFPSIPWTPGTSINPMQSPNNVPMILANALGSNWQQLYS